MRGGVESYKEKLDPAKYEKILRKSKADQRGMQTFVKGNIVGFMREKMLKPGSAVKNSPIVDGIFAGIKAQNTGGVDAKKSPRNKAFVV